jgi:hypothetical protein
MAGIMHRTTPPNVNDNTHHLTTACEECHSLGFYEGVSMTDLQTMMNTIDELSQDELDVLYRHIVERRQANWWIVAPENIAKIEDVLHAVHEEAAQMTEAEINHAIDLAIAEVRHERQANRGI